LVVVDFSGKRALRGPLDPGEQENVR